MPLPVQKVYPGSLADACRSELQALEAQNVITRLWDQDSSLWPAEEHQLQSIKNNLRWLALPSQMEAYIAKVTARAAAIRDEGMDHIVFVAMGGSNLAAAAVLRMAEAKLGKAAFLLDTTDPDALRELESTLPFERTLFVFAGKSGKRIETHALLLYFLSKLKALGVLSIGLHFVAFTEEGSYLASLAREYRFRDIFFDPPGIVSRFSGLIHFSLLLAAVCGIDQSEIIAHVLAMKEACGPSEDISSNPAAQLGSFLAAGERQGLNRLVILTGHELTYFAYRVAPVGWHKYQRRRSRADSHF